MTDLDSAEVIWEVTIENEEWALGSFGFRAVVMNNGLTNLGMLGFDNLKITAIGEVGDHLAAGKALADYKPKVTSAAILPKVTRPLEIVKPEVVEVAAADLDTTKTEYVFYENDFSKPETIADFTQYRGDWAIKDGMLYYTALTEGFNESGNFSFILYTANLDANMLSNYALEVDVYNSQSACGTITHADLTLASSDNASAFYGYTGFISNDGTKAATGLGNLTGAWGGNLSVPKPLAVLMSLWGRRGAGGDVGLPPPAWLSLCSASAGGCAPHVCLGPSASTLQFWLAFPGLREGWGRPGAFAT